MKIKNKRKVLILGGTGNIGLAIGSRLKENFGDEITSVGSKELNLSDSKSIDSFLRKNTTDFDVLVHSAGINQPNLFKNLDLNNIDFAIQTNLMGFLRVCKAILPNLKKKKCGKIIIVSSLYGFLSRKGRMSYSISKHALIAAMKTLAIEFAEFGIMVNAVSPGYINTKMTFKNNSSEVIKKIVKGIPVKKLGLPEDVAMAVSFLASPDNSYINGIDLIVDGGYSIVGFKE